MLGGRAQSQPGRDAPEGGDTSAEFGTMLATAPGSAGSRKLRLFAVACCRVAWSCFSTPQSLPPEVEVAERFADGLASADELRLAHTAASEHLGRIRMGTEGPPREAQRLRWACQAVCHATAPSLVEVIGGNMAEVSWAAFAAGYTIADLTLARSGHDTLSLFHRSAVNELAGEQLCAVFRDIIGGPQRRAARALPERMETTVAIARSIYEGHTFHELPVLGDALEEAGCTDSGLLDHCRTSGTHYRGCWVVDLVLGKE
jgi:hypothetical protein